MSEEKTVELFGGAITCVFPTTSEDMSTFRQIPDTQEVYSESETGVSIIIELLSRQREIKDEDCGIFFFHDLAKANGCNSNEIKLLTPQPQQLLASDFPQLPSKEEIINNINNNKEKEEKYKRGQYCDYACLICGLQNISKYTNEKGKENEVLVALSILRLPPPTATDILISISAPQKIHPESSEARVVQYIRSETEVREIMRRILQTFHIQDWSLFVPEE